MDVAQAPARAGSSIVKKLLKDIADPGVNVSVILRAAKIIATKLDQQDALAWINRELNGYGAIPFDELPEHRRLHGALIAWNPFQGWQEVQFKEAAAESKLTRAPIRSPIGEIEDSLAGRKSNSRFGITIPPGLKAQVRKGIGEKTEIRLEIDASHLFVIVDQVRNLLLDWALELDKAGVVGLDMDFTAAERLEAATVTNNFFGSTSIFGPSSGTATINNNQHTNVVLDIGKVRDLAQQARRVLDALPEDTRVEIAPVVDKIERLIKEPEPDQPALAGLLKSLKAIAEGAGGNLAAAGIVRLAGALLGASS